MPSRRPIMILVVEDDPDLRDTLGEILHQLGYSTVLAQHGREALELLATYEPALILLDLSMPVMNGYEFRNAQLAEPTLAAIPTVVMTAADQIEEKTRDMKLAGVLPKPARLPELMRLLQRFCAA